MQNCWKRYTTDRPHFEQILNTLNSYMDRLKRPDSVYYSDSDTDEEGESNIQREGSSKQRTPTRTPSIREGRIQGFFVTALVKCRLVHMSSIIFILRAGILHLARSGSMKLRNSFRRHNSLHKREEHTTNSQVINYT
jgi:hypothetical protein